MSSTSLLVRSLGEIFGDSNISVNRVGEVTLVVERELIKDACRTLKDDPNLAFEICVDVAGVDYASYGEENPDNTNARPGERFAVVYHLLSVSKNHRVRVRTILDDEFPLVDSVTEIWSGTNWYEREAFDMYGIMFEGHPDLRRLLTDYGFIGHPFRKDFPLSGHVEMRYDADKGRVVYQPVTIEPRTLVPRIIREDGFGDRDT